MTVPTIDAAPPPTVRRTVLREKMVQCRWVFQIVDFRGFDLHRSPWFSPTFLISTSHETSSDRPVMNDPNPGNPLTKKQVFPPYFG